nr:reverse transcriptase domain-containing protein [Tanacetum cinerariifolium]
MSEPSELIPSPPTPVVRNIVGKGNEQVLKNPNRLAFDAAFREYCDKYCHHLLPIIAEKVHQEKLQQEKLKEVKARLNFKVCSRRNSKTQEVSQYSESKKPYVRGDLRRRLRAATKVPSQEERSQLSGSVTTKEHLHGVGNHSYRVRIAEEDTRSQDRRSKSQALRKTTCLNHGIHHIKQRERESFEDFVQRFKTKRRHVKGALEWMRISRFMHEITNPELIKRLHDKIPKSVDEMIRVTIAFLRREVAASNQPKAAKKGETTRKDKPLAILMVQPWQRVARQRITQSFSTYTKISFPPLGEEGGVEGPMIIEAEIGGHFIHRIYVDGGSASEILYEHCFSRLCPKVKSQMVSATTPLVSFSEKIHMANEENITTSEDRKSIPLECTMVSGSEARPSAITRSVEERIKVANHPKYPEQTIAIGSTLTEEGRKELCGLLRRNIDIFAWKPADMTGVLRHITKHRLNVREGCSPVRQKKRSQALERNKAIQEEVEKLVDAGIIKEVHYHN